uniref:Uncharacterized protein n=1 Tax=Leersia perrieri TaxID=77586 RepID=A0A0D9XW30_9ORYZ
MAPSTSDVNGGRRLEQESTVFFNLARLEYLVRRGQWDKVTRYVMWFMPPSLEHESPEATAFNNCIDLYRILGRVACGGQEADDVWQSAAKKLKEMALRCPELKRKLHRPPDYAPKSWHINLSGVRPVPRPYKKKRLTKSQLNGIVTFFAQKRHEIGINLARQEKEEKNTSFPDAHPRPATLFVPVLSIRPADSATNAHVSSEAINQVGEILREVDKLTSVAAIKMEVSEAQDVKIGQLADAIIADASGTDAGASYEWTSA